MGLEVSAKSAPASLRHHHVVALKQDVVYQCTEWIMLILPI